MSTSAQNITDHVADNSPPPMVSARKKKAQTPHKPRLSTVVKLALEDSLKEARQAQDLLGQMLEWLDAERKRHEELRVRVCQLAPLDYRMAALLEEEKESLISIGRLDHLVARMTLTITVLDRYLTETLDRAIEAVAPPRERKNGDGGERQQ